MLHFVESSSCLFRWISSSPYLNDRDPPYFWDNGTPPPSCNNCAPPSFSRWQSSYFLRCPSPPLLLQLLHVHINLPLLPCFQVLWAMTIRCLPITPSSRWMAFVLAPESWRFSWKLPKVENRIKRTPGIVKKCNFWPFLTIVIYGIWNS